MSQEHSTPLKMTQLATVFAVFFKAVAAVVDYYGPKKAIKLTENKGAEITAMIQKVFESLDTTRELLLRPSASSLPDWQNFWPSRVLVDGNDLLNLLKQEEWKVTDSARDVLHNTIFDKVKEGTNLKLIVVQARDLGFKEKTSLGDIYSRAIKQGLYLCPTCLGPQLRLKYPDQPNMEHLIIASKPMVGRITVTGSDHFLFFIDHTSGIMMLGAKPTERRLFNPETKFVFSRHKWETEKDPTK